MNTLRRAEAALIAAERAALVFLLAFMVGLAFLQVILRGVFSSGLLWADTLLRHLVLWVGFLGGALATAARRQFAMDALVRMAAPRVRRGLQAGANGIACLVCLLLAHASFQFLAEERANPSVLFSIARLDVPAWWIELILPAGFALILLHTAVRLAEDLTGGESPEADPSEAF